MMKIQKKAVVIHSGGLDSSLCLALAVQEFGKDEVLGLSFDYFQRHSSEIIQAKKICRDWDIDHLTIPIRCLQEVTESALIGRTLPIAHERGECANTLVTGRNGLMIRLGAIHAHHLGAHYIYSGIIEEDGKKNGYRDCSREYMDLKQQILRVDLNDPLFEIRTPLVHLSKRDTLDLSHQLGILEFLLRESVSCYEGIPWQGCGRCPSCKIRNEALTDFLHCHPLFKMPFAFSAWLSR